MKHDPQIILGFNDLDPVLLAQQGVEQRIKNHDPQIILGFFDPDPVLLAEQGGGAKD